ncbi:MAG: sulfite exporter TauE/SafE family protein [Bacteroidota bacterium]|nr:sulfite exporter TauE/SafE family protein [Bacteroidota bacterium]MDP4232364.1 sulfite exporter TauE/SafE family protein [Bacteroidota bacterium]MDP4241501.1 sulfite exporter TauE/SafE family protein [Bacteroidota bacterium]MDP4289001.1 sulfite exporter TauE/SafE family protein [Bacteroidota bacterium]
MNIIEFDAILFGGAILAGFLGSLTGLGGGIVIVPLLTLVFGVDLRYAIGTSLITVIATSSGAASAFVREGYSNIRIGMFLEIATTIGALVGAFLGGILSPSLIAIIFGLALMYSAYMSIRPREEHAPAHTSDPIAVRLKLPSKYPVGGEMVSYGVQHVAGGFGLMGIAGILSGLLGIGSGAMKVIAMDHAMKLPFKVSTTTSNFMIGVTAAASAGVYLHRGYIDPALAMPVVLGVLAGSLTGAKILGRSKPKTLRLVFSIVIFVLALEMIYNGATGNI